MNSHTRVARVVLIILLLIVVYVFWEFGSKRDNRESIIMSRMECIQSVCTENKTTGELCSVREPRISEILIEADPNNYNIRNIRVIPSDDKCQ